ncbi:hypothetical protein GJ496_007483 [Pomphorhynchus laevis]|nr:hypothetical protein GJ496_007483 [Pomphorhynchus laevis]
MDKRQNQWTLWLVISCITVCLSASFLFGYGIGAPNQYSKFIEPFMNSKFNACDVQENRTRTQYACPPLLNKTTDTGFSKDVFIGELKNGIGQTLFVLGNFIGALTGPYWLRCSKFFDRRRIFYANYPFAILFAVLGISAYYTKQPSLLYVSRFVLGFQGGMACVIVSPYLNEISPQSLRGITGTFHQLFITIGILVGQLLGIPEIFGKFNIWIWGFIIGTVTSVIAIFITPFICDSPVQMVQVMNNESKAYTAMKKLTNRDDVDSEIKLLTSEQESNQGQTSLSVKDVFSDSKYKWQLITTLTLFGIQALSGINAVFFYSTKMFTVAGISEENLPYSTVCTGAINVIATIAVLPLIDRFGRRPLLVYPMGLIVGLFVVLTIVIEVNMKKNSAALAWFSVLLIIVFIIAFALGLGPIPFIYACEVFRPEARDAVLSVSLCINYVFNMLLSLFFPAINSALRGYVFLIFGILVLLSLILFYFKLPETKNKTTEEIENEIRA